MTVIISKDIQNRETEVSYYIKKYADLANLDPNLVRALITQESRFVSDAVSSTNAYGFGQFTNIGARQVVEVAKIHNPELFGDLSDFQKKDASDPDLGIKAVCAFLWWLFYVKYQYVSEKTVKLEASLTFYNAGGNPAALVVKHGGFANAIPFIKQLPVNKRSQGATYAGEVSLWYVAWHDLIKSRQVLESPKLRMGELDQNPFDSVSDAGNNKYRALIEALKLIGKTDPQVEVFVLSRDDLTEITLILSGE